MSSSTAENLAAAATGSSNTNFPLITKENIEDFDYFQLFGLSSPTGGSNADDIDIVTVRRVYRRLSLRFHPDKDDSDAARHAFEVVHTALETIIDPEKRATYIKDVLDKDTTTFAGGGADENERQRQRTQQAHDEAQWAADKLLQLEQQRRAKEEAARKEAQERAEATQRFLSELTSTLNTPFQQMEAELVRDWDVDEEMVEVKTKEVMKLLRQLAPAGQSGFAEQSAAEVRVDTSRKRKREVAEEEV